MNNYILDHAKSNVWCNPSLDNQLVIEPVKFSKATGELNTFKLFGREISLPLQNKRYVLLHVGQWQPTSLGLLNKLPQWTKETWISLSDPVNQNNVLSMVYGLSGVMLPLHQSWYMFTKENCLIFAVEISNRIKFDYENDHIFFRFYSQSTSTLQTQGRTITSLSDLTNWINLVDAKQILPGKVFLYLNGFKVDYYNPGNTQIGDAVEFVYDSSIKKVVTFTVSGLHTFTSILDSKTKYLLHYPADSESIIDYQDDIDVFISSPQNLATSYGYYYNRNASDSHRMVTHRDYSIAVTYFDYISNKLNVNLNQSTDTRNFKVELYIRRTAYNRPLVFDHSRIFELYRLSDDKVLQAFQGVNSTIPEWKAANLENASYTKIMRSELKDINMSMVTDAYGYNAISKLVGESVSKTFISSGNQSVNIPVGLQQACRAYEYTFDGLLISSYQTYDNQLYVAHQPATRMVELISGIGGASLDTVYGTDQLTVPVDYNYRVYLCHFENGIPDNKWSDITNTDKYQIVNNKVVWRGSERNQYLAVRTDKKFLSYNYDLRPQFGVLQFTLQEEITVNGTTTTETMTIPMGQLEIFINDGYTLMEGLDYYVDFPKVYITNQRYLKQPFNTATQNLHIRYSGFPNTNLSSDEVEDSGYVINGLLSANNRYDIRDDKVMKIILNGRLKHVSDVVFNENHSGIGILTALNGQPYQIKDVIVPLTQLIEGNTYDLRARSQDLDKRISDYLTLLLPAPSVQDLNVISSRYPVYSPFLSAVIHGMLNDTLPDVLVELAETDSDVIDLCKPFETFLKNDPVLYEKRPNLNYVTIYPHAYDTLIFVSVAKFAFFQKVQKLYADGLFNVSSFLAVQS